MKIRTVYNIYIAKAMGINVFDRYSLDHFMAGFISNGLLKSIKMSSSTNFIAANGLHLFIELLEKNESPTKKQLESNKNHVGDIICFLLGWLLSYHLNLNIPGILYPILWILLIYVTMHEIIREIFPYIENRLVKGAYVSKRSL
jgi:hypothetical protein